MAATEQKLELKLSVKSGEFKAKLLEAQKSLLELQNKALKAGGANDVLGAKIKKASNEVKLARNEYNLATNALKSHAMQANMAAAAHTKLGTKVRKGSNQSFTQLAYAMDDMQYGFQGVQNNIQAMAVSMGASGALVIGITAVVIGIGLMAKQFQKAQKEAKETQKALSEKQGLMASMMTYAEVVKNTAEGTKEHEAALKSLRDNGFDKNIDKIDQYIKKLGEQMIMEAQLAASQKTIQDALTTKNQAGDKIKELEADGMTKEKAYEKNNRGNFRGGVLAAQFRDAEKQIIESSKVIDLAIEKAGELQKKIFSIDVKGEFNKKDGKEDKERKPLDVDKLQSNYYKSVNKDIEQTLELMKAEGASKEELLAKEMEILNSANFGLLSLENQKDVLHDIEVIKQKISNISLVKDVGVGLTKDDKGFAKLQADFAHLALLLEQGAITLEEYARRVENVSLAYGTDAISDNYDAMLTNIEDRTSLFRDAVGKAFSDLGNTIAQNLGSNGNALSAFLGAAVGTYTKLLATNKAFLAKMIPMKATESSVNAVTSATETAAKIPFGAFVLPALIAGGLAAVSSAFSSAGAGGVASGGGGGGKSSKSVAVPSNQSSPNRENARMRNSNLIIPMDKMRYGNQVAENNYSGFN